MAPGSLAVAPHSQAVDPALRHPTPVRQNLFRALIYNVVIIPLAAVGWLHLLLADVAMAISSTTVVVNANLLRRARVREAPAILSEAEVRVDKGSWPGRRGELRFAEHDVAARSGTRE